MEGKLIMTDEEILNIFKKLQDVIQAQKELNKIINKRLNILEASMNNVKPLLLTKDMELEIPN
tara:strand:+ start:326 stop:514 length:189 start_codon:yes stop_codon:yes gene_type:complete